MKSLGLVSQILTIGLSVAIALLYIQPTFDEILSIQLDIEQYQEQRTKIEGINDQLSSLVNEANRMENNTENTRRLSTYMPRFVDDISVMRDLQFIIEEAGVIPRELTFGGLVEIEGAESLDPEVHEFAITVEATYEQVKNLLGLLELNEYPLEVHGMTIAPLDGGFLNVALVLRTYADSPVTLDVN